MNMHLEDEESANTFFQSMLEAASKDYYQSPHTVRQRRWRINKKSEVTSTVKTETMNEKSQYWDGFHRQDLNTENIGNNSFSGLQEENCCLNDDFSNDDETNMNLDVNTYCDITIDALNQIDVVDDNNNISLYTGAPVTMMNYHQQLFDFFLLTKLSEMNINKLLKIIGSALPSGHKLVKNYKSLLSMFEFTPSFIELIFCVVCSNIIRENNCCSLTCDFDGKQRRVHDCIEFITVGQSSKQLIDIIRRNKDLIMNYPRVVDQVLCCDVMNGKVYHERRRKNDKPSPSDVIPVTLMLHTDGFPVVHWTKKHTWLVTGSIVEIPPMLRENQYNMFFISLWNGPIKPNANDLLSNIRDVVKQILIIDNLKFSIDVQLFKCDLPARALVTRHVQHNAYYACLECDQKGVWHPDAKLVIYPFLSNAPNARSPDHFDECVKQLMAQPYPKDYYGVKGISPLKEILEIPNQIDLDVMHLCFIGHCSTLLSQWEKMITKEAWNQGNDFLKEIKWPHNFNVELRILTDRTYWKAHDYRGFFLYLMLPFSFSFLPEYVSSHFALYFVFLRTLYFFHDRNEVLEVESLIKLYSEFITSIYPPSLNMYSTHAHLHLVDKVLNHGALCFHNCFGNESFIHFLRSFRSGNRAIGQQICRSFDRSRCKVQEEKLTISDIFFREKYLHDDYIDRSYVVRYEKEFLESINRIIDSIEDSNVQFFSRAWKGLSEFHSLSYRRRGSTKSFVVSFCDENNALSVGDVIFFFKLFDLSYVFLNVYTIKKNFFSSNSVLSNQFSSPIVNKYLDKYYVKCDPPDENFVSTPFSSIRYKCITTFMLDQMFISEVFYDLDQN